MTIKQLKPREIDRIIEKGGNVKSDVESNEEFVRFTLRLPKKMSREIDEFMENTVGISKTGWILQTIQQKLKGE